LPNRFVQRCSAAAVGYTNYPERSLVGQSG
jgi:hypothetical protein